MAGSVTHCRSAFFVSRRRGSSQPSAAVFFFGSILDASCLLERRRAATSRLRSVLRLPGKLVFSVAAFLTSSFRIISPGCAAEGCVRRPFGGFSFSGSSDNSICFDGRGFVCSLDLAPSSAARGSSQAPGGFSLAEGGLA
jgi:hypothetical protein